MKPLFILFILLFSLHSYAQLEIPTNLNERDRIQILNILGPGSSAKMLSTPYPLGGYDGVEIGVSRNLIATEDLTHFGSGTSAQREFAYPLITIGKGLYHDFDLFMSFVPFAQSENIMHFSTLARWAFYQSPTLPLLFSIAGSWANSNFKNKIATQSFGYDLIGAFNVGDISLYLGLGQYSSNGNFSGGTSGVTDSGESEMEHINLTHTLIGLELRWGSLFTAFQIDRFSQSSFSGKIGYRF